jgi:glucosamine--fructose-6-phosphate aminotransferase (isomerizing)
MCGIIGIVGEEQVAPIILSSLKNLEYRGYDSAGIATVSDGKVCLKKDVGKLEEVQQKHHFDELPGTLGIGHVRWATHGGVTANNAHPHLDCRGNIAVAHNGIIENYQELRSRLQPRHNFTSQTDTEVIPHLLEDYVSGGASLEEGVIRVTKQLWGSYAFLAISSREPHTIVAARQGNPLVVGLADGKKFIASDALSFLKMTDQVIFVEDGEIVVATKDKVRFLNQDGLELEKSVSKVDWKWDEATKQGYDFFMLKEILEEPEAARRALMQDKNLVMDMARDILKAKQVVFIACGTSRYAALLGRYVFSKLGGRFSPVIIASEYQYFSESIDNDTLVIAVSQSGETADILAGAKAAKNNGATIFSIVNRVDSSLARMSDKVLYLNCGPEIGVAATKSFVSQLVIFYLLGFAMANRFDEGLDKLAAAPSWIAANHRENGKSLIKLARKLGKKKHCYYIARGTNFHIAGEGALKMKEIAYIHTDGMPAGELKHGSLALIEKGTPVIAICPQDYTFYDTLSNVEEAKARGAFVIGVSDRQEDVFDEWIKIPKVEEIFYPLVSIVPLQLLAYHSAIARGLDPDKPRNLAKSVTVK